MTALFLALALLQGSPPPQSAAPARPQMGATVQPETVTVGDPFKVIVRIRAARGARVSFPAGPDSLASVELLDPLQVRVTADTAVATEQLATYRMAAWDIGDQPVRLGEVTVESGGTRLGIPIVLADGRAARVHVRSVLPEDSAQRVPKPARDIFAAKAPWWRLALLIAAAVLALALIGWLIYRQIRRRRQAAALPVDPYEYAEREFSRVEALGLVEAGERGRFVALMVEVMRDYFARRLPGAAPSLTSSELLAVLRGARGVPPDRLAAVLDEADLIKFARRPVTADRARELAREARTIVREVNAAQEAAAAEAAAAAAARASSGSGPTERAA